MNNKIDGNTPPLQRSNPAGAGSQKPVAGVAPSLAGSNPAQRGSASTDSLNLTSTAALLAELSSSIDQLPEANGARIDAATDAIRNGTYQVNASTIADAILRSQREA